MACAKLKTPSDFSNKILECYGNATINEMQGNLDEAKKYKAEAKQLNEEALKLFSNDEKQLEIYKNQMSTITIEE